MVCALCALSFFTPSFDFRASIGDSPPAAGGGPSSTGSAFARPVEHDVLKPRVVVLCGDTKPKPGVNTFWK